MGALLTFYAAAAVVSGGNYYGQDGFQEMWDYPTKLSCSALACDDACVARLWSVSEQMTGVHYVAVAV